MLCKLRIKFVIVLRLIGHFWLHASLLAASLWLTVRRNFFGAFGGPGLSAIVQMMGPLGYLVTVGEFFGGLGLIFGFLSRFSAAAIIFIMLGATITVHAQFGFFMNWAGNQAGEGFEYHLLAI